MQDRLKIAFCFSDQEKLLKFKAEGREFEICSWRFLTPNQLDWDLGFRNTQEKLEKIRIHAWLKLGHSLFVVS